MGLIIIGAYLIYGVVAVVIITAFHRNIKKASPNPRKAMFVLYLIVFMVHFWDWIPGSIHKIYVCSNSAGEFIFEKRTTAGFYLERDSSADSIAKEFLLDGYEFIEIGRKDEAVRYQFDAAGVLQKTILDKPNSRYLVEGRRKQISSFLNSKMYEERIMDRDSGKILAVARTYFDNGLYFNTIMVSKLLGFKVTGSYCTEEHHSSHLGIYKKTLIPKSPNSVEK